MDKKFLRTGVLPKKKPEPPRVPPMAGVNGRRGKRINFNNSRDGEVFRGMPDRYQCHMKAMSNILPDETHMVWDLLYCYLLKEDSRLSCHILDSLDFELPDVGCAGAVDVMRFRELSCNRKLCIVLSLELDAADAVWDGQYGKSAGYWAEIEALTDGEMEKWLDDNTWHESIEEMDARGVHFQSLSCPLIEEDV